MRRRLITVTYEEVAISRTFQWKDPETGRRRQKTQKFFQTINPYNIGAGGLPKTRGQILRELETKARLWLLRQENDMGELKQRALANRSTRFSAKT